MMEHVKTVFFLGVMTAIFLAVGLFFGGMGGLIIAFGLALLMNFFAYFFSDKIVLAMYGAKEIKENENPKLHAIVNELSSRFGIPKPKVYLVQNPSPNAFATGRNPKTAAVAVTTGILQLLNEEELRGVLAHEFSHIKNRDILISTVAAVIAGAIGFIALFARFALWGGNDRENGALGIVGIIIVAILVPIIATLVRLAVSRSREYLADETAAKTINSGAGLSNALLKLEYGTQRIPMRNANEGTAHMFIANPFGSVGFLEVFSTHPPIKKRVERLRSL